MLGACSTEIGQRGGCIRPTFQTYLKDLISKLSEKLFQTLVWNVNIMSTTCHNYLNKFMVLFVAQASSTLGIIAWHASCSSLDVNMLLLLLILFLPIDIPSTSFLLFYFILYTKFDFFKYVNVFKITAKLVLLG